MIMMAPSYFLSNNKQYNISFAVKINDKSMMYIKLQIHMHILKLLKKIADH